MSYQQSAHGSQGGGQMMEGLGLILGFLLFILVGGWWLAGKAILFWSLYASFYIFQFYEWLNGYIPFMTKGEAAKVIGAYRAIPDMVREEVVRDFGHFKMLAHLHGYFQRWLLLPFMIWSFIKAPKWGVRYKYRRQIRNVYDLIKIQAPYFVSSAMVKDVYILRENPHVGPYATYDLPIDFALDHQLLWAAREEVDPKNTVDRSTMTPIPALTHEEKLTTAEFSVDVKDRSMAFRRERMPHYNYVLLDHNAAHDMFAAQLGAPWTGWRALPPFQQALYAVLCLQLNGKISAAQKLIDQIGMSLKAWQYDKKTGAMTKPGTANLKGIEAILAVEGESQAARSIVKRHYHAISVLTRTLEMARKRGRLMHSNLLWVKWSHPDNRTLWYALCGLGSQCPYWEAAGVYAHMQFEDLIKGPLSTPHVAGAVLALQETMSKEHWTHPGEYGEEFQQEQVRQAGEERAKAAAEKERQDTQKQQGAANRPPPMSNYQQQLAQRQAAQQSRRQAHQDERRKQEDEP